MLPQQTELYWLQTLKQVKIDLDYEWQGGFKSG